LKSATIILIVISAIAALLSSCGNPISTCASSDKRQEASAKASWDDIAEERPNRKENSNTNALLALPVHLAAIPEEHYLPANQQGTLVELNYDTYESKTYEQKTQN
jgi:hypothetical protein